MTVTLVPAERGYRSWLETELQSYLAELAQFTSDKKNSDGKFTYPYLDHYWREPDRHAYVIQHNGEAAGFLMVREDLNPEDASPLMEIAEIYIHPAHRKASIAGTAVRMVVGYFPGNWQAAVLEKNTGAYTFWKQLVSDLDAGFEETLPTSSNGFYVFRFSSRN